MTKKGLLYHKVAWVVKMDFWEVEKASSLEFGRRLRWRGGIRRRSLKLSIKYDWSRILDSLDRRPLKIVERLHRSLLRDGWKSAGAWGWSLRQICFNSNVRDRRTKGISEARLGAKGMYVAWSGAKGVVRLIPFNDKAGTVLIGEKEGSGESDGPRVRAEQDLGWRLA